MLQKEKVAIMKEMEPLKDEFGAGPYHAFASSILDTKESALEESNGSPLDDGLEK